MSEPLTSPDCDLRAFPTMPLDAVRLFGSQFHAIASDSAWRAGVTLWLRSWHQVPAASLPDDDIQLARLAELGRDVKAWKKVREQALHGWIKCNDGRLYHPVVAEKALDAWEKRGEFAEKQANKAERQRRWRDRVREISELLRGMGVTPPMNASLTSLETLLETERRRLQRQPREGEGEGEERDNSVTDVTDGDAVDPDKAFWGNAKSYLGKSKAGMIGKWVSEFGRDRAAAAIAQAQVQRAVDPIAYIEATLRKPALKVVGGDEWVSPC